MNATAAFISFFAGALLVAIYAKYKHLKATYIALLLLLAGYHFRMYSILYHSDAIDDYEISERFFYYKEVILHTQPIIFNGLLFTTIYQKYSWAFNICNFLLLGISAERLLT